MIIQKSNIKIGFEDTVIMYNEDLHIKISHTDFKLTGNSFGYVLHLLRFPHHLWTLGGQKFSHTRHG
jgi:hypothetical protein